MRDSTHYRCRRLALVIAAVLVSASGAAIVTAQNIPVPNIVGPYGIQVNSLTGNMFYQRSDLHIPGQGLDLDFVFSFNSQRTGLNYGYGNGWTFTYNMLYEERGDDIILRRADGRKDVYVNDGGIYDAPPGVFDVLTEYQRGKFRLREKYGTYYYFDNPDHKRLTSIVDANGNTIDIAYDGALPASVTDASGRSVDLSFSNGLLKEITDVNGDALRTIIYDYDGQSNLTTVTDPLGNSINYLYDADRNLIEVVDARSNSAQIAYTGDAAVEQITTALSEMSISYDAVAGLTVVSEPVGADVQTMSYQFDAQDRAIHWYGNCCGYDIMVEYDSDNNIVLHTDANGNSTSFSYDANGNRLSETDALGNTATYSFDPVFNHVTSVVNKNGNEMTFSYDDRGNLIELLMPDGEGELFEYDGFGNRIGFTDANGNSTLYGFNEHGYLIEIQTPLTNESFSYDGVGNLLTKTDGNGHTSEFSYDLLNRRTTETDPLANTTSYSFDANGNVTELVDANGNSTVFVFDELDRMTQKNEPLGLTSSFAYDEKGNLTLKVDPNGNRFVYIYDDRNLLLSENLEIVDNDGGEARDKTRRGDRVQNTLVPLASYTYYNNGMLATRANGLGVTMTYTYTATNLIATKTNGNGETSTIVHDPAGNPFSLTSPNGNTTFFIHNVNDRPVQVFDNLGTVYNYAYDSNLNMTAMTDGNGNTTSYGYDAMNRVVSRTDPAGTMSFALDGNSNVTNRTDANGNPVTYTYDANNRRTSETKNGMTVGINYDAMGNVLSLNDGASNTTSYTFDALGRRTLEVYADGSTRSYTYDANGNITSRTDNNGSTINYTYDALNNLLFRDYPDANDDVFTYDAAGRMATAVNSFANISFTYDNAGRVASETLNGFTTSYNTNVFTGVVTTTYPSGRVIENDFDDRGRLNVVREGGNAIVNYNYDVLGRLTTQAYPQNGTSTSFAFNNDNQMTALAHNPGAFAAFNYTYDNHGNMLSAEKTHRPLNSQVYSYDNSYQLTQLDEGFVQNGQMVVPLSQSQYSYDLARNRVSANMNGVVTNYVANSVNAYTSITTGGNTVNPIYDANGNLLYAGGQVYQYDFENRLLNLDFGNTAWYAYDPLGRRLGKLVAGQVTLYYYAGNRIIEERDGGNVLQASYVYGLGIDDVLQMQRGGNDYYYHRNSLGSVVAVTDVLGTVVERYEYDGYGNTTIYDNTFTPLANSAIGNPYMFTGRRLDPESGLYFYRARSYDPVHGRFLQRDPIGFIDGMNLSAYVLNNPINYVDPSGYWLSTLAGAIVGAVVGAVTAAVTGGNIAAGAAGGAVTGALIGSGVPPAIAGAAGGAVSGAISGGAEGGVSGAVQGAVVGAVTGAAAGAISGGLSSQLSGGTFGSGAGSAFTTGTSSTATTFGGALAEAATGAASPVGHATTMGVSAGTLYYYELPRAMIGAIERLGEQRQEQFDDVMRELEGR